MKIKYLIYGILSLIALIAVIFFTKYIIGILAGAGIIGGSIMSFKKLMDIKTDSDTKIKANDTKIKEVNNVITDNKTSYETYKDTIDNMSNDADLLNESARLRSKRRAEKL